MNVFDFAKSLLTNGELEAKLQSPSVISDWDLPDGYDVLRFEVPGRMAGMEFSDKQLRFPRRGAFREKDNRARAMHSFANHELLAVEMMAAAILKFPLAGSEGKRFRKTLVATIIDEQKHLSLYMNRMEDFGLQFGELPLNSFFWRQMNALGSPEQYFALMSMTFEAANLDFAAYYADVFREVEDDKSATIMDVVLKDEISHVTVGANWLQTARGDSELYEYYQSLLPEKITPSRAKGIAFYEDLRLKSGLDAGFVNWIRDYKDDFRVTNRREWK